MPSDGRKPLNYFPVREIKQEIPWRMDSGEKLLVYNQRGRVLVFTLQKEFLPGDW